MSQNARRNPKTKSRVQSAFIAYWIFYNDLNGLSLGKIGKNQVGNCGERKRGRLFCHEGFDFGEGWDLLLIRSIGGG